MLILIVDPLHDTRWFDLEESKARVELELHLDTPFPSEATPIRVQGHAQAVLAIVVHEVLASR